MSGAWQRSMDRKTLFRQWLGLAIALCAAAAWAMPRLAAWPEGAAGDAVAVAVAEASVRIGWNRGRVHYRGRAVPIAALAEAAEAAPDAPEWARLRVLFLYIPLVSGTGAAALLAAAAAWRRRRARRREVVRGARVE